MLNGDVTGVRIQDQVDDLCRGQVGLSRGVQVRETLDERPNLGLDVLEVIVCLDVPLDQDPDLLNMRGELMVRRLWEETRRRLAGKVRRRGQGRRKSLFPYAHTRFYAVVQTLGGAMFLPMPKDSE